jgi:hypothetical protein
MYNAIWATYKHYCSNDENPQHDLCPKGENSWCTWQQALALNKITSYTHDYTALPDDVAEALKPIYTDLSSKTLLERCVGGFNQNNNESYNQLIWKITPKVIPCGSKVVQTAAYIAAGMFNEGAWSLLFFMSALGISLGPAAHKYADNEDIKRIFIADARAYEGTREGRMARRQLQLDILDQNDDAADTSYGPGIDDTM